MRVLAGLLALFLAPLGAAAQTPQPFPTPRPAAPAAPGPPATAGQTPPAPAAGVTTPTTVAGAAPPELGAIPLYPNAVYVTSYEAGRGQRFHLYGVALPYADVVNFYRIALKQKGDELFQSPPTHQFEIGRYREQDMAFPPSVTIKDFTWGGSAGYVNPKGGQPERFRTLIQIVQPPPTTR